MRLDHSLQTNLQNIAVTITEPSTVPVPAPVLSPGISPGISGISQSLDFSLKGITTSDLIKLQLAFMQFDKLVTSFFSSVFDSLDDASPQLPHYDAGVAGSFLDQHEMHQIVGVTTSTSAFDSLLFG